MTQIISMVASVATMGPRWPLRQQRIFLPHDSVGAAIGAVNVGAAIGAARVGAAMGAARLSVGAAIGAARLGATMGAARVGAMMGDNDGAGKVGPGLGDIGSRAFVHSEQHAHITGAGQSATNTVKFAKSHMSSGMLPVKRFFSNRPVSVSQTQGCETQCMASTQ
jgi:cytochrome c2